MKLTLMQGQAPIKHFLYPLCDASKALLSLMRSSNGWRKSFLKSEIPILEKIGFEVEIIEHDKSKLPR